MIRKVRPLSHVSLKGPDDRLTVHTCAESNLDPAAVCSVDSKPSNFHQPGLHVTCWQVTSSGCHRSQRDGSAGEGACAFWNRGGFLNHKQHPQNVCMLTSPLPRVKCKSSDCFPSCTCNSDFFQDKFSTLRLVQSLVTRLRKVKGCMDSNSNKSRFLLPHLSTVEKQMQC